MKRKETSQSESKYECGFIGRPNKTGESKPTEFRFTVDLHYSRHAFKLKIITAVRVCQRETDFWKVELKTILRKDNEWSSRDLHLNLSFRVVIFGRYHRTITLCKFKPRCNLTMYSISDISDVYDEKIPHLRNARHSNDDLQIDCIRTNHEIKLEIGCFYITSKFRNFDFPGFPILFVIFLSSHNNR